jgi:hypothetical protein
MAVGVLIHLNGIDQCRKKTRIVSEFMQQKTALEAKLNELLGASSRIEDLQIQSFADPLDQIKSNLDREIAINQLDVRAHLVLGRPSCTRRNS